MDKQKKINVLSITPYGKDLAAKKGAVFSGGQQRQVDYAGFLDKYIIIAPAIETDENEPVKLKDNLIVYPVNAGNKLEFLIEAYKKACSLIKQEEINIITCDNPFDSAIVCLLLKIKFKLPTLVHSMAEMIDNPHYIKERKANVFKNLIAKVVFRFTDFLRVSTNTEIKRMAERGFDSKKILKASFYVDFNKFEGVEVSDDFRKNILGDKYDKIVLFLGRIALQKDIATTIKAIPEVIKEYPKTLFAIIGDGPEFENVKNLVNEMKLTDNVWLPGRVKYTDVIKYYKASDIFCATSIYEGTCMTLHEAGICKLPIVATDFAGAVDLIKDGENGYLVSVGDTKAVAEKIKLLLSDEEKLKQMGERNYEIVRENFSREKALEEYRGMFENILE